MKRSGAVLFFALLCAVVVVFLTPRLVQIRNLETRRQNLETEIKKLQTTNRVLENELRLLREDPVYLEKIAREKFNKAKQGEIVYKVVREGEDAAKPAN